MLNEWSDRPPPRPPRPLPATGEFWVGVFTVLIWLGLLIGFVI
jgi:hypothetical protein